MTMAPRWLQNLSSKIRNTRLTSPLEPALPSPTIPFQPTSSSPDGVKSVELSSVYGSSLCWCCSKVFSKLEDNILKSWTWTDHFRVDYYDSLVDLTESVQRGCQLCNIILDALRRRYFDKQQSQWGFAWGRCHFSITGWGGECDYAVLFYLPNGSVGFKLLGYDQGTESPDTGGIDDDYLQYRNWSTSTEGHDTWRLCRLWIEGCLKNHQSCRNATSQGQYYPTRLLYVGGDWDRNLGNVSVRVELTESAPPRGSYLTLSHCWGDSRTIPRLTVANHDRMLKRIPFMELPQTFRDAICLTRFLGSNYIWIDSLCIVQDSPGGADWKRESEAMTKIYQNSLCNIAATSSLGPTGGCFRARNPLLVRPLLVNLRYPTGHCDSDSPGKSCVFFLSDMWTSNIDDAPLNRRAWVVQERVLATRQIHCARDQIFWECLENAASETFSVRFRFQNLQYHPAPTSEQLKKLNILVAQIGQWKSDLRRLKEDTRRGYPDDGPPGVMAACHPETIGLNQAEVIPPADPRRIIDEIYKCWIHILEVYSRCYLTFETDKLVAISGVAGLIEEALAGTDTCIAGLWQSLLPYQLLWRVKGGYPEYPRKPARPLHGIAPSWSWASTDAEVEGPPHPNISKPSEVAIIDVLGVNAEPHDQANISLQVRCLLYKLHRPTTEDDRLFLLPEPCYPEMSHETKPAEEGFPLELDWPLWIHKDNLNGFYVWSRWYFMPILKSTLSDGSQGLILDPCGKNRFRRVGYWHDSIFYRDSDSETIMTRRDFLAHLNTNPTRNRHTISLY